MMIMGPSQSDERRQGRVSGPGRPDWTSPKLSGVATWINVDLEPKVDLGLAFAAFLDATTKRLDPEWSSGHE